MLRYDRANYAHVAKRGEFWVTFFSCLRDIANQLDFGPGDSRVSHKFYAVLEQIFGLGRCVDGGPAAERDGEMTYSIVARDPNTRAIGIGVASRFFACGALVPYVSSIAAFASQAFVNPLWGIDGLNRLDQGDDPDAILADLLAEDLGHSNRQAHMISPLGKIAQFTGSDCVPWAGHVRAAEMSAAGNMLAGPQVLEAIVASWETTQDEPLIERLLAALEAGEAAGGDKRGRQAAALKIHIDQPYPALDLRVDDHADPLAELRRLKEVSEERFALFRPALPTREQPSGLLDRAPLDKAIAEKEREMAQSGNQSRSYANGS